MLLCALWYLEFSLEFTLVCVWGGGGGDLVNDSSAQTIGVVDGRGGGAGLQ